MDTGTGLTILGSAVGSAKLVEKLLGPTADYIGEGIKEWAQKRHENVARIFKIAAEKLGGKLEQPGSVPPKIFKGILDAGSFCDDKIASEYFGGVLASSRSESPRDDRGARIIALLERLSSYQVRSHYIFYYVIKQLYDGTELKLTTNEGRRGTRSFLSFESYMSAMSLNDKETKNFSSIITHVTFGLVEEGLIGEDFATGAVDFLKKEGQFPNAKHPGIVFSGTVSGIELFFWAHGKGDLEINDFLKKSVMLDPLKDIQLPQEYLKVTKEW